MGVQVAEERSMIPAAVPSALLQDAVLTVVEEAEVSALGPDYDEAVEVKVGLISTQGQVSRHSWSHSRPRLLRHWLPSALAQTSFAA